MDEILKAKISLGLVQTQRTALRQELRETWNERLRGPLAFAPSELMGALSEATLLEENHKLARFAASYLKTELLNTSDCDRKRRIVKNKLVVGVGYGKGYDAKWVSEAVVAGLSTRWVDVSDVACEWARVDLNYQWLHAPYKGVDEPNVIEGEIEELLSTEPDPNLDQSKVEIWYLCRLLGCLKEDHAFSTLELLGRSLSEGIDSDGSHRIVLVNALRDDNPMRVGKTSQLYERKEILKNLERGAERKVFVKRESNHRYFNQVYTAMTIYAYFGEE